VSVDGFYPLPYVRFEQPEGRSFVLALVFQTAALAASHAVRAVQHPAPLAAAGTLPHQCAGTLPAESVIQEIKDILDQPIINLRFIHRQVLSSLLW
jgi:hypothetical protein